MTDEESVPSTELRPGPILIVDDDPQLRQILQWALEDEGLEVQTAADGEEAVKRGTERRPAVVILDMTLPVLDGYQVAAALRATFGEAPPIVMITADGRAAEKASRVGAFTYLRKPFEVRDLVAAVQQGLARE